MKDVEDKNKEAMACLDRMHTGGSRREKHFTLPSMAFAYMRNMRILLQVRSSNRC